MQFLIPIPLLVILIEFTASRLILDATAKTILRICEMQDLTANLILPESERNNLNFLDGIGEIIEIASENPKCPFRVEFLSEKRVEKAKHRRFTIFIVKNFENFSEIFIKMSKNLNFKKFFLILLLNGNEAEAKNVLKMVWKFKMFNVDVIYEINENLIAIATFEPFHDESCDHIRFFLIDKFENGKFVKNSKKFFPEKLKNLQSCPLRVATSLDASPCVYGEKLKDGGLVPSGSDVEVINALSQVLNFKINFTLTKTQGFLDEDGTAEGTKFCYYSLKIHVHLQAHSNI